MILKSLGIYGWAERDENVLLASLLTGDPLLLIGNHGCAKTLLGNKLAAALGKKFIAYDASKAMFEDVLGFPNVEKLRQGTVEYVSSAVTVWDKEFILIDELNRAVPELQSKWLEVIRSRKIMGIPTAVKWVWAAMNPITYSATQTLDEALIGRFAAFLYPPDVLDMDETDRMAVAVHINGEDAPALDEWGALNAAKTVSEDAAAGVGAALQKMLCTAAGHFHRLRSAMNTLPEFLSRLAELLMRETKHAVALDGRRLGFIYRNVLALRAVELARAETSGTALGGFSASAVHAIRSGIPIGLNDRSVNREETLHKVEVLSLIHI